MKRDSAVFYKSWKIAIDRLGDSKRGEIYEMILDYAIDSIYPKTDDPVALMIFDLVRVQIDVNNQRYANGKKGGRPKTRTTEQIDDDRKFRNSSEYKKWRDEVLDRDGHRCVFCGKSSGKINAHHKLDIHTHPELRLDVDNGITLCNDCHAKIHAENNRRIKNKKPNDNQTITDNKPNVNVNENENVNVIESNARARTRESQMQMFDRLITGRAVSHDMADALREWIEYKDERNERYKEAGMRSLITQAVSQGAAYGSTAVINVIRTSMASGYKGIVWDRCKRIAGQFNNYPERNYDMDSLELKLLATN